MSISPIRRISVLLLICCATAFLGCRSHRHTIAPSVAPQTSATSRPPEVKVEPPRDFGAAKPAVDTLGNDPGQATLIAEEKGWLRDAFFDFDSSVLTPAAQQNLTRSADWLRGNRKLHVLIEGHCDERGTEKYNLALGDHRAWEAKEYLSALGIDPALISTVSYGKERPFDLRHNEEAWAKNRRAHLLLTSTK